MFNNWLINQLRETNWSQADLARASGLTTAATSKYVGGRVPDMDALKKIAKAFKLPAEIVYRAAGVLAEKSTTNELIEQIDHLVLELPEEEQQDILDYIRHRREQIEKRKHEKAKKRITAIR